MSDCSDWPDSLNAEIGANIRAAREAKKMSVSRLAARTVDLGYGLHRIAVITRVEAGERAITVPELIAIAAALDTAPLALVVPERPNDSIEVLPGVTMNGAAAVGWFTGTTSATPAGVIRDPSTTAKLELVMQLNQIDETLDIQRHNLYQALEGPKKLAMPDKMRDNTAAMAKHAREYIASLEVQRAQILELLDEHQGDSDGR